MNFKLTALKKVMETFVYPESLKTLDTTPIEDLSVEAVMSSLSSGFEQNPQAAQNMAKAELTEDDIRDVVKSVVPKLRKEKERRMRFVR